MLTKSFPINVVPVDGKNCGFNDIMQGPFQIDWLASGSL